MNDHEKRDGIDPDRAEGSVKKMGGNLKEAAGDRWDDKKMKREGEAEQAEGKLQNAWGGVKDKARGIENGR